MLLPTAFIIEHKTFKRGVEGNNIARLGKIRETFKNLSHVVSNINGLIVNTTQIQIFRS